MRLVCVCACVVSFANLNSGSHDFWRNEASQSTLVVLVLSSACYSHCSQSANDEKYREGDIKRMICCFHYVHTHTHAHYAATTTIPFLHLGNYYLPVLRREYCLQSLLNFEHVISSLIVVIDPIIPLWMCIVVIWSTFITILPVQIVSCYTLAGVQFFVISRDY